ncbi:MAG: HEPN domain-containing protein [Rhabdochlamydiaceae bacterium]
MQSLLFYSNYKFENIQTPKEEYNKFFDKMREKLDDNEKQFVDRFRGMGNQLSLKQQLEKIFLQLDFWKAEPSKLKKYIDNIVEVRNRISHATKNVTSQTYGDAINMTHNLTSFISSLILFEIKFQD